jgi:hypothetical protein
MTMTDSVSMNLGNPANVLQTTIHEIFEIEAITHTGFAFEQLNPRLRVLRSKSFNLPVPAACRHHSRPLSMFDEEEIPVVVLTRCDVPGALFARRSTSIVQRHAFGARHRYSSCTEPAILYVGQSVRALRIRCGKRAKI